MQSKRHLKRGVTNNPTSNLSQMSSMTSRGADMYIGKLKQRQFKPISRAFQGKLNTPASNYSVALSTAPSYLLEKEVPDKHRNRYGGPLEVSECSLVSLAITGLNRFDDELYIRRLCRGVHIVDLKVHTNRITGECTGTASMTVRYSSEDIIFSLKRQFKQAGLLLNEEEKPKGRTNSYTSLANRDFLDPHISHIQNQSPLMHIRNPHLNTSDDLFGSSPGVGRMSYSPEKERMMNESFVIWEKVKKSSSFVRTNTPVNPRASFLKSTLSWNKKLRDN